MPLTIPAGPRPVDGWPVILGNTMRCSPAVADVDGDGRDEIAIGIRDGRVFLLDGNGQSLPNWPRETGGWVFRSPILDDVNGDGRFEVVAVTEDGTMYQWRIGGSPVSGWPIDLGGRPTSSPKLVHPGNGARPRIVISIGGTSRRAASGEGSEILILEPDGRSAAGWPKAIPDTTLYSFDDIRPVEVADLDGDGSDEILHLSSHRAVLRAWRADGSDCPGFPLSIGEDDGRGIAVDDPKKPSLIACTTQSGLRMLDPRGTVLRTMRPLEGGNEFVGAPFFLSSGASPKMDRVFAGTNDGTVYLWDMEGRLQPGWPVRLGGFIYGLEEKTVVQAVFGPPIGADADGDGKPEIVIGCYNHHLYCLEFDGRLVPGWPVTAEDAIVSTMALAQLDGSGPKELIVGQIGETMFAYRLGAPPEVRIGVARPGRAFRSSTEWPSPYFAALAAFAVMVLLVVLQLRKEHVRAGRWDLDGWSRVMIFVALGIAAAELAWGVMDLGRYRAAEARLVSAETRTREILMGERRNAQAIADVLAAELDSSLAGERKTPLELLVHLERLSDHHRLDNRFTGILVTDAAGSAIIGVELGRGWTDISQLGVGAGGASGGSPAACPAGRLAMRPAGAPGAATICGPVVLEEMPVFVSESARKIGAGADSLRLFFFSSLLGPLPDAIADATQFSAFFRLENTTLAWGGAALPPSGGVHQRSDRTQPARDIAIIDAPGKPRLTIHLAMESFERWSEWRQVVFIVLAALLYPFLSGRRTGFVRVRLGWWWIPLFVAVFVAGVIMYRSGAAAARHVSFAGRVLEIFLYAAGMLGFAVAALNIAYSTTSRRLDIRLLGSYLLVSLIPLAVIVTAMAAMTRDSQYRHIVRAIDELVQRADNLSTAYVARFDFPQRLDEAGGEFLGKPPETAWFNFVADNQLMFTYDLPTAFLTVWAHDRNAPDRYFTGFSFRAPRRDKLYTQTPAWMGEDNQKGLFLDKGTPVIRAVRLLRTRGIEARVACHIPLDNETLAGIEKRLHVLPFLPYVRVEPSWPESPPGRALGPGWYLPFTTEIVLQARDWDTGAPRWVAYRTRVYVPPGPERFYGIIPVLLLLLLPLGLSMWGAYSTFQWTVKPLKRLIVGIRRVEQGDLEYRLQDVGKSEIALAAQSFDKMAESLERKVAELAEKKKVEEVSELKSHFISMVSHDLKTPLASIKGAAENVLEELAGPVSPRQRTYLEMILKSSDNLQRMISNLLDLSRIESGHLKLSIEIMDLKREIEHIIRFIQPLLDEKSLETRIVVRANETTVAMDRTRLWQIINNLLANAIRHSPRKGRIDILIEGPSARAAEERPVLTLSIVDQGPGIPEDDERKVFEPFHIGPSETPGALRAGLGLAIVKQLVELHGGAVSVTRAERGGACFVLTLPTR